jgi:hypothetical protein
LQDERQEGDDRCGTRSAQSASSIAAQSRRRVPARRAVQGNINDALPAAAPKNVERSMGDRFDEEQAEFQASGQNRANDDLPAHEERFHPCTSGWTTGARTVPRPARSQMT